MIVSTEKHSQKQPTHLSTSTETLSLVWTVWRGTGVSWILTSEGVSGARDGGNDGDDCAPAVGHARGEGRGGARCRCLDDKSTVITSMWRGMGTRAASMPKMFVTSRLALTDNADRLGADVDPDKPRVDGLVELPETADEADGALLWTRGQWRLLIDGRMTGIPSSRRRGGGMGRERCHLPMFLKGLGRGQQGIMPMAPTHEPRPFIMEP